MKPRLVCNSWFSCPVVHNKSEPLHMACTQLSPLAREQKCTCRFKIPSFLSPSNYLLWTTSKESSPECRLVLFHGEYHKWQLWHEIKSNVGYDLRGLYPFLDTGVGCEVWVRAEEKRSDHGLIYSIPQVL